MLVSQPDEHDKIDDEVTNRVSVGHDFWLFGEGERDYYDYRDLLPRRDAPVLLSDNVVSYLMQYLQWVPTLNPRKHGKSLPQNGLNQFGPTVIASMGGEPFRHICLGWAQILAQGPEPLILRSGWFHIEGDDPIQRKPCYFRTSRDSLITDLQQLAQFGEKAASGEYFILHLGI